MTASLAERLRRLRGAPGAVPPAPSDPSRPSLAERLNRLAPLARPARPARPTSGIDPASAGADQALAEQLGAAVIAPGLLLSTRQWSLRRPHGRYPPGGALTAISALLPGPAPANPIGWVFFDTETSGLAGGTGTWAFLCGLAHCEAEHLVCHQYLLTRLDAEPALWQQVGPALAGASLWVSFNGKTFDLPLISTRLQLTGQPPLPLDIPHLDLLHPLRRAFASRWPDCRLGRAEQDLLGFTRDHDLPGAEAPAAWRDWLQRGDAGRLGAVLRHNRLDLISLVALIPALAQVQQDPGAHGADRLRIARHLLRQGRAEAARHLLSGADAADPRARLALAQLHRRARDWPAALALWQPLAAQGEPAALLALAKYHEHVSGDPLRALALAERLPTGVERERRCARLRRVLMAAERLGASMV